MKRGQLTIFVIMAIIIVAAIIIFFSLYKTGIILSDKKTDSIDSFVGDCLTSAINDAIFFDSLQGGYLETPNNSVSWDFLSIPIYWDGSAHVPSLNTIKEQLGYGIELSLLNCTGDFSQFQDKGYEVSYSLENISASLKKDYVSATLNFPITLKKGDSVQEYKTFSRTVRSNFFSNYNLILQASELQKKAPDSIPLTQYSELAFDNDFTFEITDFDNETVIYSFVFNTTTPNLNLVYNFGAKYP